MAGAKVKYNFLGNSGLKVSNLCLGTMTFGERDDGMVNCNEDQSHLLLDRFVEHGGNFIDTANIYQNGKSEEIVGSWLANKNRANIVIATKLSYSMDAANPNGKGLSRASIMREVDDSLRRLRTDYIDLYQIHCWDYGVPIEETMRALNDLVRMGKVRYIGASNVLGWQMQKMADICKYNGWQPVASLQAQYSLLCRQTEFELVDVCQSEGIGLLPWSPLKGGWLSGKFKRNMTDLPGDSRIGWATEKQKPTQNSPTYSQFNDDKSWNLLDLMETIGKEHGGRSVAQVALRWLLQKSVVPSVVIGAKRITQLDDNMAAAAGWELSETQMTKLDEASKIDIPYPYEMVWRLNKDRQRKQ